MKTQEKVISNAFKSIGTLIMDGMDRRQNERDAQMNKVMSFRRSVAASSKAIVKSNRNYNQPL